MDERSGSRKQYAYEQIRRMIETGQIEYDAPLVERVLCEKLGMSRTPVREALRELVSDGLLEQVDGKGVYLKRISFRALIELYELREALERMAVRLFVERIDEEHLESLRQCMEKLQEAYDAGANSDFMKQGLQMHLMIAEGSRNQRLAEMIRGIYGQISQIAFSSKDNQHMRDAAILYHQRIYEAVRKGDPEEAQEAIVHHIVELKEFFKERYYII